MHILPQRTLTLLILLVAIVGCQTTFTPRALAQDSATKDGIFYIKADIAKLQKQLTQFDSSLDSLFDPKTYPVFGSFKTNDVQSIDAIFSLPVMRSERDFEKLPSDFRFTIHFKSETACASVVRFMEQHGQKQTKEGIDYFVTGIDDFPVSVRVVDTKTLTYGTDTYVRSTDPNLLTSKLTKIFSAKPTKKPALEFGFDLEHSREGVGEYVGVLPFEFPEDLEEIVFSILQQITLSIDFDSPELAKLSLFADTPEKLKSLERQTNKYLKLAAASVEFAAPPSEKVKSSLKQILETYELNVEDNRIDITFKRPKEFPLAVKDLFAAQSRAIKRNYFRMAALACLNYESANGRFPFDDNEDWSWRASILEYAAVELANSLDLQGLPNDEQNQKFADQMPDFLGENSKRLSDITWVRSNVSSFADITDGSSNTIMLLENPKGSPWMENNPLSIDQAVQMVSQADPSQEFFVALYDGSIHTISSKIEKKVLRNLFDPKDSNPVDWAEIESQLAK